MRILKGMKDLYGVEIDKYEYITDTAKKVFEKYGYLRIITPVLEQMDLFKRTVGDETDVVSKEMYEFIDKGNRLVALRPEFTAGVVRAYIESKMYTNPITKLYYYGNVYRYEAPQKGRQREFNQVGIECFGTKSSFLDAHIIYIAIQFLSELGIDDLTVEINTIGNIESRVKYINVLKQYLLSNYDKLSENSKIRTHKNPLRVLDSKEDDLIIQDAPKIEDYLDSDSLEYFNDILYYLDKFNIKYIVNNKLVRGLDYYNDTVFEIKSNKLGAQSTVLAGGRYDRLGDILSNKSIPAIGFAAGLERLSLLLDDNLLPVKKQKVYIVYFEETKEYLFKILELLNDCDYEINFDYEVKSFNSQIKKANKIGAKKVIILGVDEINNNYVSIKDFETGVQKQVHFNDIKGEINV